MSVKIIFNTWIEIYEPKRGIKIIFPKTKGDIHKSIYRDPVKLLKRLRRSKFFMVDHFSNVLLFNAHLNSKCSSYIELEVSEDFLYEITDGMNTRVNNGL